MEIGLTLLGIVVVLLYAAMWIAGPLLLTDWTRNRREETIKRQIALTDAIHEELGPIVSPEVKKPLWGPWQIRIAVPLAQSAVIGRILGVAHEVLSVSEKMSPDDYQIVLVPQANSVYDERRFRTSHPAERWPGDPVAAA